MDEFSPVNEGGGDGFPPVNEGGGDEFPPVKDGGGIEEFELFSCRRCLAISVGVFRPELMGLSASIFDADIILTTGCANNFSCSVPASDPIVGANDDVLSRTKPTIPVAPSCPAPPLKLPVEVTGSTLSTFSNSCVNKSICSPSELSIGVPPFAVCLVSKYVARTAANQCTRRIRKICTSSLTRTLKSGVNGRNLFDFNRTRSSTFSSGF